MTFVRRKKHFHLLYCQSIKSPHTKNISFHWHYAMCIKLYFLLDSYIFCGSMHQRIVIINFRNKFW